MVLLGESPGREEAKAQHGFVGWSGKELTSMLISAGIAPPLEVRYPEISDMISFWASMKEKGIFIANVFDTHPPSSTGEDFFSTTPEECVPLDLFPRMKIDTRLKGLKEEYLPELENLYSKLDSWKPNLVVALGNFASWATLGETRISSLRGTVRWSKKLNLKILPTYHPAALRDRKLRPTIIADLIKAFEESEFPEIRRIPRYAIAENPLTRVRPAFEEIKQGFANFNLSLPETIFSVDIESGWALFSKAELDRMPPQAKGLLASLISMVSIAPTESFSLTLPFMTRDDSNLNYWPPEIETQLWLLLGRFLANPSLIKQFQNGMYDIGRFLSLGFLTYGAQKDTMIAYHALYPELPKSLGYLGSIFSRETAWKLWREGGESLKGEE